MLASGFAAKRPRTIDGREFHLALGKAYQVLGDGLSRPRNIGRRSRLMATWCKLTWALPSCGCPETTTSFGLSVCMPRSHRKTHLEIGIDRGQSLSYARPPTRAVAVDPEPKIDAPLKVEAHLFCETSDVFFAERRLAPLLNDQPLTLAFIDGLHVFQQSLKDFMHVESFCGPRSVVLIHGTIPLDELTQRPDRQRKFYGGDVWKTVLCLKHYRPDLDIFTIATPPTGLTVVTGLDPTSRILTDQFEEAMATICRHVIRRA